MKIINFIQLFKIMNRTNYIKIQDLILLSNKVKERDLNSIE